MIPVEFIRASGEVRDLIKAGRRTEALQVLERISQDMLCLIGAMTPSDRMEVLGNLALRYREAGTVDKELPLLEELCAIATQDLRGLDELASLDDICQTATDIVLLGVAYLKSAKTAAAREHLIEARKLFDRIDWEIDVESMIAGHTKCYVGPSGGREQVLTQVPELPPNSEPPALMRYNFASSGRCYVYYPRRE